MDEKPEPSVEALGQEAEPPALPPVDVFATQEPIPWATWPLPPGYAPPPAAPPRRGYDTLRGLRCLEWGTRVVIVGAAVVAVSHFFFLLQFADLRTGIETADLQRLEASDRWFLVALVVAGIGALVSLGGVIIGLVGSIFSR